MGHKTLIGGTAYKIKGGKTLVNGTGYNITKGRTLVNGTGYDISFELPPNVLDLWSSSGAYYSGIQGIAYGNGYFVVCGVTKDTTLRIAYATDLNGPWTIKDLATNLADQTYHLAFGNGYFAVAYHAEGASSDDVYDYGCISYVTQPAGTWKETVLWRNTNNHYCAVSFMKHVNGYWVVGGKWVDNGTHCYGYRYAGNLTDSWAVKVMGNPEVDSDGNMYGDRWLSDIEYGNGYYVICGSVDTGDSTYPALWYTTSINNALTSASIDLPNYRGYSSRYTCVTYKNGYWVVGATYYNGSAIYAAIRYATQPNGTWTTVNLWSGAKDYQSNCRVTSIDYADGYWVVTGNTANSGGYTAYSAYAQAQPNDPLNTLNWILLSRWHSTTIPSEITQVMYSSEYDDGRWIIVGNYYDGTKNWARLAHASDPAQLGQSS